MKKTGTLKKVIMSAGCVLVVLSVFCAGAVSAKKTISDAPAHLSQVVERTGVEKTDIKTVLGKTAKIAFGITGILFLILMVYAGLKWMMGRGNEEAVKKARGTLIGSVIGITVVVGAYAITNFFTARIIEGKKAGAGAIESVSDIGAGAGTGCCMDKVGANLFGEGVVWACRIDTYENCERLGNLESPGDVIVGEGTWKWFPKEEWPACEKRC